MRAWELSKTLDQETLRDLVVNKRKTDREIAEMYDTTAPTIRYHRLKANPPIRKKAPERISHRADNTIPWILDMSQGHQMDPMARLLRHRNRLKHGLPIPADARPRIADLERHLKETNRVINYTRELGFHTVRRDPKLDKPDSIVRVPSEK
ncbi:MAG TPA: hypothetical protein VFR11_10875 [Micromonosporaceae bacterium]|jgi:hypothetical protein|nr:hypothetical protein [Micromonosporaceae bacterium]